MLTYLEIVLRLGFAVLLGGLIGFNRRWRQKPAGLRTHMLVALASALFMIVSLGFHAPSVTEVPSYIRVDLSRIASNVVVGMGFLGAGVIMRTGGAVRGLTTAASLWFVASVGLAAGSGLYFTAGAATAVALFVLGVIVQVERRYYNALSNRLRLTLTLTDDCPLDANALVDQLRVSGVSVGGLAFDRDLERRRTRLRVSLVLTDEKNIQTILDRLDSIPGVRRVNLVRERAELD